MAPNQVFAVSIILICFKKIIIKKKNCSRAAEECKLVPSVLLLNDTEQKSNCNLAN